MARTTLTTDATGIPWRLYDNDTYAGCYECPKDWKVPSFYAQRARTSTLFSGLVLPDITSRDGISPDEWSDIIPSGWDGVYWFLPKIAALGRIWGVNDPYGTDYGKIVEHLFGIIGKQRGFRNHSEDKCIRINEQVRERIIDLENATSGDFLPPMPITFGKFYRGHCSYNVREIASQRQELPFCTVQVASLVSVLAERFFHNHHKLSAHDGILGVLVSGDECDQNADGKWSCSPSFEISDSTDADENVSDTPLNFFTNKPDRTINFDSRCGAAVGLPGVSGLTA